LKNGGIVNKNLVLSLHIKMMLFGIWYLAFGIWQNLVLAMTEINNYYFLA
jgi:hypothetical protein